MALEVEWALSRSSVLLVNSLARSKSECLNFNALGALVAQPNRLQNRLFLVNVTKPVGRLRASPGSGVRGRVRRTGANDPVGRHAVWRAGLRNHRPARRGRLGSRRPSAADRRAVSSAARGPLYLRSAGPGDSPRQCASDGRRHPLGLAAGAAFARGAADRTPLRAADLPRRLAQRPSLRFRCAGTSANHRGAGHRRVRDDHGAITSGRACHGYNARLARYRRPTPRLRDVRAVREYGAEQPVHLAVDPVGEVEGIGIAVITADPEPNGPKPAWLVALADSDRDCPAELPGRRIEGIDLAMEIAEVADQQMIDEPAETGWRQSDSPGRGEAAAGDQLCDEAAVFIENRHGPRAQRGAGLAGAPGRRIGHVNVAADLLHVERDQPGGQRGVDECAGREAHWGEGAVEDVDAAGPRIVSGIKARLSAVDRQPGVDGPGGGDLDKGRRPRVPGRNGSVQIGEDEVRETTVSAIFHQERRSVGIVDLAGRSLDSACRSSCRCRDRDEAGGWVYIGLADG